MNNLTIISLSRLCEQLGEALGQRSLLYEQLSQAIRDRDDRALREALDTLALYPEDVRSRVEEVILTWLFGGIAVDQVEPGDRTAH